jgi:hypothetical protein
MATAITAAKHICLGVSRFNVLVGEGVFKRMPPGRYDLTTIREAYCRHAQKMMAGRAADGGASLSKQRARLATAQAEKAERANAVEAGEYVAVKGAVDDVDRFIFRPMREILLTLAGKCSDGVAAHSQLDREAVFEIINRECRQALTMMSMIGGIIEGAKQAGASQPENRQGNDGDKDGDKDGEASA